MPPREKGARPSACEAEAAVAAAVSLRAGRPGKFGCSGSGQPGVGRGRGRGRCACQRRRSPRPAEKPRWLLPAIRGGGGRRVTAGLERFAAPGRETLPGAEQSGAPLASRARPLRAARSFSGGAPSRQPRPGCPAPACVSPRPALPRLAPRRVAKPPPPASSERGAASSALPGCCAWAPPEPRRAGRVRGAGAASGRAALLPAGAGHGEPRRQEPEQPDLKMLSITSWVSRVVVLFASVLATASIAMPGEWGEEGVTYGELGSDVALTCPGASPSSTTEWQRDGGSGLPRDSSAQQGQLLLPRVELSSEGIYSCYDGSGLLLGSVALRVGRLPGLPSVSCRASNYENFSCFWTPSAETLLPTRYVATYQKKQPAGTDQQRPPVNGVGLCVQDPALPLSCTVSKSQFWSSYRVNVTEVNPLGSSFSLLDITVQTITKPDPPEGLRVEPVPLAPKRLRVSWEYPSTWPKEPSFQLRFRLRYRPVLYDSWSVVETATVSEVITDAFMGLEHVVQVSARDFLDAGSWSEWSPEARGWPAAGQIDEPGEAATATTELETPAEEPSPAPKDKPVAGHGDSMEKVAVLVSLGVFAFFVLVALLLFALLVWIRAKKLSKEADKSCDLLAAATHLKALPRAQLL